MTEEERKGLETHRDILDAIITDLEDRQSLLRTRLIDASHPSSTIQGYRDMLMGRIAECDQTVDGLRAAYETLMDKLYGDVGLDDEP